MVKESPLAAWGPFKLMKQKVLNISIKFQILFGIAMIQTLVTFLFALYQHHAQRLTLEKQSIDAGISVAQAVKLSITSSLLVNDFAEIDTQLQAQSQNTNVLAIKIYGSNTHLISSFFREHKHTSLDAPRQAKIEEGVDPLDETNTELKIRRHLSGLYIQTPVNLANKTIGWIQIEMDETPLNKEMQQVWVRGFLVTLFSFLIGIGLSIALAHLIVGQIERLRFSVEEFGKGNNQERAEATSKNEIGNLARGFNQMADQLTEFQIKLTNSAKFSALGEMASGIAHEINNPLAIIVAKAETLQSKVASGNLTPEKITPELQKIVETGFRITKIVSSLRSLSRDGEAMPAAWFPLDNAIADGLDLFREKLTSLGIQLILNESKDLDVYFSRVQLGQVIVNLLSNSLDAIQESETPWIEITVVQNANVLELHFKDSGKGIPAHIRQKIMTPFFTTKELGKGTGLGLSISKGIIEKNGGTFSYDETCPNTKFIIGFHKFRPSASKSVAA